MDNDIIGKEFGRLKVVGVPYMKEFGSYRKKVVECVCECGEMPVVVVSQLRSGHTRSCGCLMRDTGRDRHLTHGMKGTKEYLAWKSIKTRTRNASSGCAHNYMLRGITMSEQWDGPDGFQKFFNEIGPAPSAKHSVDRIDNDRGYEPGNVRWATRSEQNRNTRQVHFVDYEGVLMPLIDASIKSGVNYGTLHSRVKRGLSGPALFVRTDLRRRKNNS